MAIDRITLVSATPGGTQANGVCYNADLSSDGRYVVFESWASNLTAGDDNGFSDIFVKDLATGTLSLVSISPNCLDGNTSTAAFPRISGDGDAAVDNAASVAGPGGFARGAELVIVTTDISGAIDATSAAAAIGSASSAYWSGAKRLFVVDNGTSSALFLFTSSGADAAVSAAELTQIASLANTPATALGDYVFVA